MIIFNVTGIFMFDKDSKKVILLAGIGAFLEFYDFIIYGIF
ncbi:MAG: hypothetical protein Kow0076_8140 [Francisella sp.]